MKPKRKPATPLSMATRLTFILLLLIYLFILASPRNNTFLNALEVLSASGYLSMALTLGVTSKILNLESTAATIFAPWDPAFVQSGQPPLLNLLYHISPTKVSVDDIKKLPSGATVPTLLGNQSLVVTSSWDSDGRVEINGVLVQDSAVIDYESIIVYGITDFFNFTSENSTNLGRPPSPDPVSGISNASRDHGPPLLDVGIIEAFQEASEVLISRGYSIMSAFLDVQLFGLRNQTRLTVFAPVDVAMEAYSKNMSDFSMVFRKHVVPGLFSWQDLVGFAEGTSLQTFSRGFLINVSRSGDVLVLNGAAPVVFPDLYSSKWLAVHGLNRLLVSNVNQEMVEDVFSGFDWDEGESNLHDYGEYGYGAP